MATILLSLVILPLKGITASIALSLGFLVSEVPYIRIHWKRILKSVLFPYIILVLVAFAIAVVTSPHLHEVNALGFFGLSELLTKQMALVYSFLALRKTKSIRPLLTVSFVALVIMTLIGVLNYAMGYSFFVEEFLDESYSFMRTTRFRVQATFNNPFNYGYICVLLAILHLYGYMQRMEPVSLFIPAQLCCLFGVITCNCRTILFCYLVCAVVFAIALQKNTKVKMMVFSGVLGIAVIGILLVPIARKLFLSVLSIFDPNAVVEGSSLSMRFSQLATVLYYISGSVLFGRGVHFFEEDLGWDNGSGMEVDADLYGLEGIHLNLLLERGVVGLVLFVAMMLLIVIFIVRHRRMGRKLYALGLSVFVLYILFCFMTGELLSTVPTFYILGYVLANFTVRERYLKWIRYAKPEE
ncbi:MAG: hypothetical protein J5759_00595 [Bacteroidales bacterium]|nr:hypothetical protein [Bacteroidales bacterium]